MSSLRFLCFIFVAESTYVFPSGFAASCVWLRSVAFPLPGLAMCTEWVRVEVRTGSVVKLSPVRSLHLRALAFPSEKPSRDFSVVQSCEAMRNVTRRNPWQLRECWNGSSIDRVSGERELLPSASERILCPLRFQETRGGSEVCHFGFKAHVFSVPVDVGNATSTS